MIRFALALMMFASVTQASPFPPLAQSSLQAVWKGLEDCGLKKVDAYHPSLPRPQTPAARLRSAENRSGGCSAKRGGGCGALPTRPAALAKP